MSYQTDPPISPANPIIGTPRQDAHLFPGQQNHDDTCAIRCQEFIIKKFTGVDVPEETLMREASRHGWYTPGHGTNMSDMGRLLELHHIAVNRYEHANVYNLTSELAQGHKVMIGVDSSELWNHNSLLHHISKVLGLTAADHAVVVSGIDTSDAAHIQVIISDPGTGEAAAHYPLDQFVAAWKDSDYYMVATQSPPPQHMALPEMAHFDYSVGHISHIGNLPYEAFETTANHVTNDARTAAHEWSSSNTKADINHAHASHDVDLDPHHIDHHTDFQHSDHHHTEVGHSAHEWDSQPPDHDSDPDFDLHHPFHSVS